MPLGAEHVTTDRARVFIPGNLVDPDASHLLLEIGDSLLLESGDFILLEQE